jgi:glycerophosphoryl diester phosphodiesterase
MAFRRSVFCLLSGALLFLGLSSCRQKDVGRGAPAERPIVIAHRGASGYRPEHTLAAYELAIAMGADYVEPDLVSTRDGVLIARHENEISGTTDVAGRYPERRTRKQIDGKWVQGWFTEDFTLQELRTLSARERLPELRGTQYDGRFPIPTLLEILDLVRRKSQELGRPIGIYPETKHPTYFASVGLPLEERLVSALSDAGLRLPTDPAFIQSFEPWSLRKLRRLTRLRLILLIDEDGASLITAAGLREIKGYADGIGPNKRLIISPGRTPSSLVTAAHAHGLLVHPWTFRREAVFLPPEYHGDAVAEMAQFCRLGVDGLFSDFPDLAREAVDSVYGLPGVGLAR